MLKELALILLPSASVACGESMYIQSAKMVPPTLTDGVSSAGVAPAAGVTCAQTGRTASPAMANVTSFTKRLRIQLPPCCGAV
jgi:hypothetical protein